MQTPQLIAADNNYNPSNPLRIGRKLSLYYIKGTGFYITVESIQYIESVDQSTAQEHYKFCQKRFRKFPKEWG